MPLSSYARADFVILMVTVLASAGWAFSREALHGLPPLLFIGSRFLLAGVILLWMARSHWSLLRQRPAVLRMLGVGVLMAVALQLWVHGLAYGGHMGEGAFITGLAVVMVPLASWMLFRERVARTTWLALPVAATGMACLSLPHGFRLDPGQWFYLGAAILFSFHFALLGRLASRTPTLLLTSTQLLMVGLGGLLVSLPTETMPDSVSLAIIGWFLASAVIATSLRFALQTYGQSLAPASHAALILMLEPVWTTLLGMVFYNELMLPLQLAGCGLIFIAIIIGRWRWVRALWPKQKVTAEK